MPRSINIYQDSLTYTKIYNIYIKNHKCVKIYKYTPRFININQDSYIYISRFIHKYKDSYIIIMIHISGLRFIKMC